MAAFPEDGLTLRACQKKKRKSQNKNKRTPRSLHEVCSHANDACTFLRSRWTVKALVLALSTQPQLLALPSPLLTRKGSLPKSCSGSTLGLFLTSSAKWNVCFIQDYNMEFKWLRTLKWGENRLADDFPADLCRNQNNGKGRECNGDCRSWVYFRVVQQWNPLEEIRELWKGPSRFKAADLNPRGYRGITGENFQMTTLPTLRASDVPCDGSAGWISSVCSPDPSSIHPDPALCPCGLHHQAPSSSLFWLASATGR